MKILKFLAVFLAVLSVFLYGHFTAKNENLKDSQWTKIDVSIAKLLDSNYRSIVMPQLLVFNNKKELILHLKSLKTLISFDYSEIINRKIPEDNDFQFINPLIHDDLNETTDIYHVFLIYPNPESLPMKNEMEVSSFYNYIFSALTSNFKDEKIAFSLLSVYQGGV